MVAFVWLASSAAAQSKGTAKSQKPGSAGGSAKSKQDGAAKVKKPFDATAVALLEAHNREREKEKLPPLALSSELCEAAAVQAKDIAAHHLLDHTGSDGSTVGDRVKRTGYVYLNVAENIADGQSTVESAMKAWMDSPPHRESVLGDYTEMGAARAHDDQKVGYWAVVFALPFPKLKPAEAAADVLKEWNRERKEQKKPLLRADAKLAKVAMTLTKSMADKETTKIDGDPFKELGERGRSPLQGRELRLTLSVNVATAKEAAKSLVDGDAAEFARFVDVGIGYALSKKGNPYWCAVFSRPVPANSRSTRLREDAEKSEVP
jgi:uncharacterized protein YkwD